MSIILVMSLDLANADDIAEIHYHTAFHRIGPDQIVADSVLLIDFQDMPGSENFGFRNGNYWFKVSIKKSKPGSNVIMQIPTHNLGMVSVYRKVEDSLVYLGSNVTSTDLSGMVINHRFPTFQFNDFTNDETLYLSTHFHKESNFPVRVYAVTAFHRQNISNQTYLGLYYGFLFAVVLFNMFFFFELRERAYLYYVILLCSYSMAIMFQDGVMRSLGLHVFPFDLEAMIHWLSLTNMFVFSIHFLGINHYVPKFRVFAISSSISMLGAEVIYLVSDQFIYFVIADVIAITSFICTWVITLFRLKEIKYAKFFLLGYSVLITLGFHHIFAYDFGLFANHGNTLFLKIAGVVDMIIFSYAISYRQRIISKEHDELVSELRTLIDSYNDQHKPDPLYQLLEENSLTDQSLTLQEVKVLKCINQGMTNREIAEKLFVSYNTIKFHVRNIYQKLQVSNREEVSQKLMEI